MNAQLHTDDLTQNEKNSRLTGILRALGALAIGGSGLVYMLQGLQHTDTELRNWIYLALIAILGLGGIFSFRFMQDTKGARLFFALASLLIPVQFSQLGGMVLGHIGNDSRIFQLFEVVSMQSTTLYWIGGLSLLTSLLISFAAFSVLCRSYAKSLSFAFMVLNAALVLPYRLDIPIIAIVVVMAAIGLSLEHRIFQRDPLFRTGEGICARLMVLLPISIAICRSAFHYSDTLGACAILATTALAAIYLAERTLQPSLKGKSTIVELLQMLAFVLLALTLPVTANELFHNPNSILFLNTPLQTFIYAFPLLLLAIYFSGRSQMLSLFYQIIATAVLAFTAAAVFSQHHLVAQFVLWSMATLTLASGFIRQHKLLFLTGIFGSVSVGIHLIFLSIRQVDINLWLFLAIAGLVLVALSSVIEKHGKKWLANSRDYWRQFNEWETR